LVADSHSIVARLRNYFSQLFNVHGVTDVGKAERNTAASEFKLAIDKLKSHISPGIDQIPAELIKAEGRTTCLVIHKLIISILKKKKLPEELKESIVVAIQKKRNKTYSNNYRGISGLQNTYKILSNILPSRLIP